MFNPRESLSANAETPNRRDSLTPKLPNAVAAQGAVAAPLTNGVTSMLAFPPATPQQQCDSQSQTKNVIMAEFVFLQKKFPGARVYDVLAAAHPLLDGFGDDMRTESNRVKAAICLGVGA